jgi:hypothetical protein
VTEEGADIDVAPIESIGMGFTVPQGVGYFQKQ